MLCTSGACSRTACSLAQVAAAWLICSLPWGADRRSSLGEVGSSDRIGSLRWHDPDQVRRVCSQPPAGAPRRDTSPSNVGARRTAVNGLSRNQGGSHAFRPPRRHRHGRRAGCGQRARGTRDRPGPHRVAHGHDLAEERARRRRQRAAACRQDRPDERRAAHRPALCRGRAGAAVRGARRRAAGQRRARPFGGLLLARQVGCAQLLRLDAVRPDGRRDDGLAVLRRRHGLLAGGDGGVRHPAVLRRLERGLGGRLVPQGDQWARRPQGPQVPDRRARRRGRAAPRRDAGLDPARRGLPGDGGRHRRCRRVHRPLERPGLRPLQGRASTTTSRAGTRSARPPSCWSTRLPSTRCRPICRRSSRRRRPRARMEYYADYAFHNAISLQPLVERARPRAPAVPRRRDRGASAAPAWRCWPSSASAAR